MKKPSIRITVTDRLGPCGCHRGHHVGEVFDFDTQRGDLCPMAMHALFPYIDILRYGGTVPPGRNGDLRVCCPDADTALVFLLETVES